MTTLVSWLSVDSRRPSALYVASDSRISWALDRGTLATWDIGRKVFSPRTTPDVFGFAGDVVFTSLLLSQVADLVDLGALFSPSDSPSTKAETLLRVLQLGLDAYPVAYRRDLAVVYGTRDDNERSVRFHLFVLRWTTKNGWSLREKSTDTTSSTVLVTEGSGSELLEAAIDRWNAEIGRTSRSVFGAFCEGLSANLDPKSGGAPQLVQIRPKGPAVQSGIIWNGKRYAFGHELSRIEAAVGDWRNERFEICDPETLLRMPKAQRQPPPNR